MKALILNSGIGSRLEELTKDCPKCLLPVRGRTILDRQLASLTEYGLDEVIITTGPFEEKIIDYVSSHFPSLKARYVHNQNYASTNYIYSIYLARALLDDDLVLLHGDLVFEKRALPAALDHNEGVIINDKAEVPRKDFKGRITDGIVAEIGVNVFGENCFMLQPLYVLPKEKGMIWWREIENFIQRGEVNVYAENAFNRVADKIRLKPIYFHGFCMEIDTKTDLSLAEDFLRTVEP
ncbi:MAG: NTP transferase domain-containing protein [Nanoarchaeota archaeon]